MLSNKNVNKKLLILMALIFMMLIIPASFANDNSTDVNTVSLNQSSDASQIAVDDSSSLDDNDDGNSISEDSLADVITVSDVSTQESSDANCLSSANYDSSDVIGDDASKSIYVATTGNDTEGTGSQDNPYASISKALSVATGSQNLIFISNGTYKENNLKINSNVNITGLGNVIIDGNNAGGIFTVTASSNITLKNLTFINAKSASSGGVINIAYSYTVQLYVDSVNFINNTLTSSSAYGGAIWCMNTKGKITILNSNFIGNVAGYGGAIVSASNTEIIKSTFINNKGTGTGSTAYGGAVRLNTAADITGCVFTNNSAASSYGGGAIAIASTSASNINYNVFINNTGKSPSDVYVYNQGKKVNADYNWWASNDKPSTTRVSSNVILNKYVVLTFTSVGSTLYAKLNALDTGEALPNPELLPVREVVFTGNVNPTTTKTVGGVASTTYSGTAPITATVSVDGVTLSYAPLNKVYVNSVSGSDTANDGTYLKPFLTIQKAINSVATNGTIVLNGTFKGEGNTNLTISNSLTITSETGSTIDGEKTNQLANIASGNVTLSNLNLVNGYVKGNGGAIAIASGLLTINNVTFTNNTNAYGDTSSKFGGALYSNTANVSIIDSKFINNTGYDNGGAVYVKEANLSVVDSSFENNAAYSGAAIYMSSRDSSASVEDCVFTINKAETSAAIYTNGKLAVLNSKFTNNTAKSNGGAIYASNTAVDLTIGNSVFVNNSAKNGGAIYTLSPTSIESSEFVENTASSNGGAISIGDGNITSSLFEKNSANNGGAIYVDGNLDMNYTVLVNNKVSAKGSAIYSDDDEANIKANTNWWGTNSDPKEGLIASAGSVDVANWIVGTLSYERFTVCASLNSLNTGANLANPELFYTRNVTFEGEVNSKTGTLDQETKIANTTYLSSSTGTVKATIDNQELSVTIATPIPVVYVNADKGNDITGDGSQTNPFKTISKGLSALTDNGKIILEGTFKGIKNTNLTIDGNGAVNVTIVGVNNAVIDGEHTNWLLEVTKGSLSIYNLTLTNAHSIIHDGGAISLSSKETITLDNVTFSNNQVLKKGYIGLKGGAIYTTGLTIIGNNTKFINNTAPNSNGGAIYSDKSADILISGNNILFDSNEDSSNGVVYARNINITGDNIKFINNKVGSSNGGAIYASGDVTVSSNGIIFDNNTASYGGAIYANKYAYIYANNTVFTNNHASSSGGAIYAVSGIKVIGNNAKFINSSSGSYGAGGAIYTTGTGGLNITGNNTLFENNIAKGTTTSYGGGAIMAKYIYISGDNTKFINNSAAYGGAILTSGTTATQIISFSGKNTQFINNNASSNGIIYSTCKIELSNALFEGNVGKLGVIYSSNNVNINYCAFNNNAVNYVVGLSKTSLTCNIDNNWWGNNTPDFTKLTYNVKTVPSSYAVLNLTADEFAIPKGTTATIAVNAYWNGTTSQDNIGNIPFNKVYLNTTGGSLANTEGNLVEGKFSTEFSADVLDTFTITSKLDNEIQNISVAVEGETGTVLYVSTDGNDNNNGLTRKAPLLTIGKAIEIAKNNNEITTIMIDDGVYTTSGLTVALSINIIGQSQDGTIINGNGKQIFNFASNAKVNLTSLTLKNGASTYGGAITNTGNLIINECTFVNNTASKNAGAIDNSGTLSIVSSLFVNNTASNDAGAISSVSSVSLTITNSTFINNTATRNGGVIKVQKSQAIITNSTFDSNTLLGDSSGSYGGAIYGWVANINIYNSTFTNNNIKANGQGGAIFVNGESNTFEASGLTIINNSAATGSAVFLDKIGGSLTNSIILNNTGSYAIAGSGSAAVNNNWWGNTNTNTTFNTDLVNGITTPTEWVILNLTTKTTDIFAKDSVDVTIDLIKTQLGNTVDIIGALPVIITAASGKVNTTIVNLTNGKATVKYTAVTPGEGYLYADVYGFRSSIKFNISDIPHIIYVDTINGDDTYGGNSWESAVKTIEHALTLLNEDKDTIYIANGTYNEHDLAIDNSVAIVGFGNVTIDANSLGRIFEVATSGLDIEFKNINFVNGNLSGFSNGGAIDFAYGATGTAFINNCTFTNCHIGGQGGAINNYGYKLTINNSVFINNSAALSGAICIVGGETTVLNSIFINNSANSTYKAGVVGGAIKIQSGNATVLNCVFTGNNASLGGSAIAAFNSAAGLVVNYCIFEGYPTNVSVIENTVSKITVDANYNYFGNNNNPDNLTEGNVNTTYWTILTVTPDTDKIVETETVKLNIDFTKYTDGTNNYTLSNSMPNLTITFEPIIGFVTPSTIVTNGIASVDYVSSVTGKETILIYTPDYSGDVKFTVESKPSPCIYVDAVNGNDTYGGNSWSDAVKTIAHALTLVTSERNTIYLANGTYNEHDLAISKSVSIVGSGNTTIDANSLGRIFSIAISDLDVNFKNINFVNGKTSGFDFGGAINFANGFVGVSGSASIDNCTFTNCHSSAYGGAISNNGYNLTVSNSIFVKNGATFSGAICAYGGAITVLNSSFINNTVDGTNARYGAGIRVQGGNLTVLGSTFFGNDGDNASAIYADQMAGNVVVNYCIFENYTVGATVIGISERNKLIIDANYNYFGTNDNPANLISDKVNATYWTILNITPATSVTVGETAKLNIDFTKYTDGNNTYALKEGMPTLTVTLQPTMGNVNQSTVVCENGVASVDYISSIAGKETISVNAPYYVGDLTFNVLDKETNVIYVSVDGNDTGSGSSDSPLQTLAAAIAKNHELGGDKTICLLDGTYSTSGLNINDDVIIVAKNNGKVIFNGKSDNYIINSTAKLTIRNVTFSNANEAIVNSGELSIETSSFANNKEAISSTAGSVTVSNSKFIGNDLGINVENTTLSLNNNIMKDNTVNVNFISGSIISKIQVVFLNNSTLRKAGNESFVIGATVCDDVGNTISGGNITFTANGAVIGTGNIVNGVANYTVNGMDDGTYTISGTSSLGDNLVIKTGTLNIFSPRWFIGDVGYETLADAVEAANNGDVIEGLPGTYKYTEPVEILKNITIKNRGNGEVILDGSLNTGNYIKYDIGVEYINNILRIPYRNATVNLYNLIFTNAYNQGHGGAIYNHGNLSIYNCTFVNNTVVGDPELDFNYGGAAVFSYNGKLTIRDSYFVNNTGYEGGAIYGAADSDVVGVLDINNSKFENNKATTVNDAGGAIYAGNYLKFLINNTEFIGNLAPTKHSQYIAGGTGGAIYIRSTIASSIANSNFVNNSAFYWGGAIKSYAGSFDLTNCNFTGNYAGASGGALHISRSASLEDVVPTVNNCIFSNNDAGSTISAGGSSNRGGAICVEGIIAVYNSAFYGNTAVDGGAIYAGFANNMIDNCTFVSNSAVNGGAINNYHGSINVTNSYFEANIASYGGAIANYQTYGYVNLLNNTYVENSAAYGGAIYSTKSIDSATANILSSEFVNNSASAKGNELYINGNANINYNSFVNNVFGNVEDIWVNTTSVDYVSIENNWWGTSSPNWNEILTNIDVPKVYAVLNATLKESGSRTYDLIIDMYWNGTSSQVNISNIPARTVKLNATGGSFNVNESQFVNGEANAVFNKEVNKFNVTATVDNEIIKFNMSTSYSTSVNVTVNKGDDPRDNVISVVVDPTKATGNVTISIDGEDHVVKLVNGQANFTVSNLTLGEHTVNVTYNGDDDYDSSNTVITFNETFSPIVNLTVEDVVKYFNGTERLVAVLKDSLGNPLANETIIFNVNGNEYTRITDANGSASMAINLNPGTYKVFASFNGTKLYDSALANATVTVKSTVIGQNIVKMFRNGTQYYCLFLDSEGKALVNTTVKFNINGVMYERQTNESGIAKLNINLNPGNYVITNYNPATGEQNSNNITVKSLITDNYDLVKYYKNESKYTVKVYGKDGSVAVNQEVTFNINGVFYKRTTDENGTVSLAINLRPGDYVITTEYEGCSVSNNITVKPTLLTDDLSMTYHDGSKYNATVLDGQGKPLANQNVVFNVNGVFYNKVTDSNGVASLNINLMKGKYIITSMWNDYQVGNNIIIK